MISKSDHRLTLNSNHRVNKLSGENNPSSRSVKQSSLEALSIPVGNAFISASAIGCCVLPGKVLLRKVREIRDCLSGEQQDDSFGGVLRDLFSKMHFPLPVNYNRKGTKNKNKPPKQLLVVSCRFHRSPRRFFHEVIY